MKLELTFSERDVGERTHFIRSSVINGQFIDDSCSLLTDVNKVINYLGILRYSLLRKTGQILDSVFLLRSLKNFI